MCVCACVYVCVRVCVRACVLQVGFTWFSIHDWLGLLQDYYAYKKTVQRPLANKNFFVKENKYFFAEKRDRKVKKLCFSQ